MKNIKLQILEYVFLFLQGRFTHFTYIKRSIWTINPWLYDRKPNSILTIIKMLYLKQK